MKPFFWLIRIVIFLAVVAFALSNQQAVIVHFLPGKAWDTSLVWALCSAFILGIIFGVSAMTPLWMGQRRAAKHANTQANQAHSEAQRLAAPPPAASSKKPTSDLNDELGI